jgi:hypothetical protein
MKAILCISTASLLGPLLVLGCETSDPTSAVLNNEYPAGGDPSAAVAVYKAWWSVALFAAPVAAGAASDSVRVVPGSDYAYALLAPGWDPTSDTPPAALIPVRTAVELAVDRGDTLSIVISDSTTVGNCSAGKPLAAEDASFIVERIFPGEFVGVAYDPATCTAVPVADAGGD